MITIPGITEKSILRYFVTLNSGDFTDVAALFTQDGVMYPPVDLPVRGRDAIASYLWEEAQDIRVEPQEGMIQNLGEGKVRIEITGRAHTSWCSVNVMWLFILNSKSEISEVSIKLLAAPQDLLSLRPPHKRLDELPSIPNLL
ncbi:nuclear transport factor 2 [Raphidiopsis curvata NIES-932]|nr:nuclear transport factor 2 [Raphidiopsis curvata NIES-932]